MLSTIFAVDLIKKEPYNKSFGSTKSVLLLVFFFGLSILGTAVKSSKLALDSFRRSISVRSPSRGSLIELTLEISCRLSFLFSS